MLSSLNRSPAVKNLIIINVLVFVLMNFTSLGKFYDETAFYYFDDSRFEIWQVVTHMFQHAKLGEGIGIMHIVFNMFVLFQFGSVLEKYWGWKKFLFFYFFAGIGAAFFYTLNLVGICEYAFHTMFPFSTIPNLGMDTFGYAVGASGAISGVVAAFAFLHPNTELMLMFIPIPIKAKYLVSAFFAFDLLAGLASTLTRVRILEGSLAYSDGIAHFAHLGGAIFGFLLIMYWQKNSRKFY